MRFRSRIVIDNSQIKSSQKSLSTICDRRAHKSHSLLGRTIEAVMPVAIAGGIVKMHTSRVLEPWQKIIILCYTNYLMNREIGSRTKGNNL